MTPTSIDTVPLVSPAAIARASRAVIANAMAGDFPIDPVIGPDLSKSFSIINSVVKRHGLLIQRCLGDTLAASGRFEILTEVRLPITEAAHDLLTSDNSDRDLRKIRLKADSNTLRMVAIDLVVVDTESGWAGAYDVKRGNGATESRKRRPFELDSAPGRQATGNTEGSCRTTLTVSEDIHRAVRRLAADARCKFNDVIVIAIEDALLKQGVLASTPSRLDLRRRLGFLASENKPSTPYTSSDGCG